MKIGYILQAGVPEIRYSPFSGPANHVRQVCQEWLKMGYSVQVLAFMDGKLWKSDDLVDFTPVHVPAIDSGLLRLLESAIRRVQSTLKLPYFSFFESLRFAWACSRELRDVDILYERIGWFGFGGWLASRWMKVPLVLEINGDLLNERKQKGITTQGLQHQIAFNIMKITMRGADGYVATGEGHRRRFAEQWMIELERILVVDNGSEVVDLLTRDQLHCFQWHRRDPKEIQLVFTGSFEPWQGLSVLIEAFALASQQEKGLHLSVIGSGVEREALIAQVAENHLESQVSFLGWLTIDQMAARLACSDIGISPYCGWAEFFGLKLLDYKGAGLATIASGIDGQPSAIRHMQTGIIVPPCDVKALSDAILQLSRDEQLRKHLGRTSRIEAEKCHSWRNTAENLIQILSKIIRDERKN